MKLGRRLQRHDLHLHRGHQVRRRVRPRGPFLKWPQFCNFIRLIETWQGVKLTRLMSIFTSKKVWKFLIKNQLTKSDPKRTGVESALPRAN